MSEWISFDRWSECAHMEQAGILFQIVNAQGEKLLTKCTPSVTIPFDWKSQPTRFRLVKEGRPRRSNPLPPPATAHDLKR